MMGVFVSAFVVLLVVSPFAFALDAGVRYEAHHELVRAEHVRREQHAREVLASMKREVMKRAAKQCARRGSHTYHPISAEGLPAQRGDIAVGYVCLCGAWRMIEEAVT